MRDSQESKLQSSCADLIRASTPSFRALEGVDCRAKAGQDEVSRLTSAGGPEGFAKIAPRRWLPSFTATLKLPHSHCSLRSKSALRVRRHHREEKEMPVDSMQEQVSRDVDGRVRKGQSRNPKGRPMGARNNATEAAERLLDGGAEA